MPNLHSKISLLLLLSFIGLQNPPVFAVENSEKQIQQERIKAQVSLWRESSTDRENPSPLAMHMTFPDKSWWEHFGDPFLSKYITQAIQANISLELAHQRLLEARALSRQALGKEFPQVAIAPSFTRSRNSATIIPSFRSNSSSSTASSSGGSTSGSRQGGSFALGQTINNYTVPLTVNYEFDLWQKNRDATRATGKDLDASANDLKTAYVAVITDVANAYFNLLAADELVDQQKNLIAIAETDLYHSQNRFDAGLVDQEDVVLRQGRLTNFKAQLQDFYQSQAIALNQLAVLMGQTSAQVSELPRAKWEQYEIPTEVNIGLPSELLTRRPDILSAEKRLEAAGFRVRVARKEMLPSINLSGQFGYASASQENLFKWDSYVASAAASLLQPVFTGGQRRANLKVFKSRYEQQLLSYRDTILQSFREVDDSLASIKAHRNAYDEYRQSLDSLLQRQKIQQNRLDAGAISDAEINPTRLEVVQALEGLTRTKLLALSDTISLYKALGGGY
jgi:outer membrane protein, multidrug efflux system